MQFGALSAAWSRRGLQQAGRLLFGLCWLGAAACSTRDDSPGKSLASPAPIPSSSPIAESNCEPRVPVYRDGTKTGEICVSEAEASGLTVIDLSDDWLPESIGHRADDVPAPTFGETFVQLANEDYSEDDPAFDRARDDRYLELYGVFPSLTVMRTRMADINRHICRRSIDNRPLISLDYPTDPWRSLQAQRADLQQLPVLRAQLERARESLELSDIDALAKHPRWGATYRAHHRLRSVADAIERMQDHLKCEGLLGPDVERGVFNEATTSALHAFQRIEMIVGWRLDQQTAAALVTDPYEAEFRALLRALRERVVDASGLIEDGSAAGRPGLIVDRIIDTEAFRRAPSDTAEDSAPDLIAVATDAAARAIGWTDPGAAKAFLDAQGPGPIELSIAVRLPPAPAYHSAHMDIFAEVDPGDVIYENPNTTAGARLHQRPTARPTLTLWVKDGQRQIALARWGTTIGGWQPARQPNRQVAMEYKGSPVGPRVWRDIVATPAWVPPASTPRRDLLRPRTGGGWAVKSDLFGPGYASAYGLVMMIHHRQAQDKNGEPLLYDEGIRTHGSAKYDSIHSGYSHGCHRLHNHTALRLSSFLLKHRAHRVRGPIPLNYHRSFAWYGKRMDLSFDSRGYRYELTPPVAVNVLAGRIIGPQTSPSRRPEPLTPHLSKRFMSEAFSP